MEAISLIKIKTLPFLLVMLTPPSVVDGYWVESEWRPNVEVREVTNGAEKERDGVPSEAA